MTVDPLLYLSAHEQLRLFRERKLSPVEMLQAQIARIEAVGAKVNALTHTHFDEAMEAAKRAEARYRSGEPGPLDGITIALKEEYGKAGWITTAGSKLYRHVRKDENHPVVDKLLAAGAVLHAQTTAPEFYLVAVTWSDLWGVTRNPWNLAYTTGGSSGGSGAALAAGMTTLATGSDMGGSIRIPAALNGLYGFKPPYGRIASAPESALLLHASLGPMARNFSDMALLHNVMSGPVPGSGAAIRPKLELPPTYPSVAGWKIALSLDQGWAEISADVRDNTLAAVRMLERAGAVVQDVDLGLGLSDAELRAVMEKALFSTALGGELAELAPRKQQLTTYARYFVELASEMGSKQAKEAADMVVRSGRAIEERVFRKGFRALVTPTTATTRIPAGYDPTRDQPVVNDRNVDPHVGWFLTSVFNLLNWMPVINVPTGRASNNVPTGMQIAAQSYDDVAAAAVASAYAQGAEPFFAGTLVPDFRDQA